MENIIKHKSRAGKCEELLQLFLEELREQCSSAINQRIFSNSYGHSLDTSRLIGIKKDFDRAAVATSTVDLASVGSLRSLKCSSIRFVTS